MSRQTLRQDERVPLLIVSKQSRGLDRYDMLIHEEIVFQLLFQIELQSSGDSDARDLDQRLFVRQSHQTHGLHIVGIHDNHCQRSQFLGIDDLAHSGISERRAGSRSGTLMPKEQPPPRRMATTVSLMRTL